VNANPDPALKMNADPNFKIKIFFEDKLPVYVNFNDKVTFTYCFTSCIVLVAGTTLYA
jgi:hypothetical protein